jgi:hypothetical protein
MEPTNGPSSSATTRHVLLETAAEYKTNVSIADAAYPPATTDPEGHVASERPT